MDRWQAELLIALIEALTPILEMAVRWLLGSG
jgi:hypothetical protein